MSHRILILFAHPALEKSRVQYPLVKQARATEGVTFHDLYQCYPDFMINIGHEQALLQQHDIILLQFPLLWYSTPSMLKEWQDLVLEYGFAYGNQGNHLTGKCFGTVISTGGDQAAYNAQTPTDFTMRQLLYPLEKMASFCNMTYLPPFVIHGALALTNSQIEYYTEQYQTLLNQLKQGIPNPTQLHSLNYLNDWIS